MSVETRVDQPRVAGVSSSRIDSQTSSNINENEVFTHEEVFGDVVIDPFSLEDALDILEISEIEFQEQLDSRGFCPKEDFDRNGNFPVGWIGALDTLKWMVD